MKKIKFFGKSLSKNEQKHFSGGLRDGGGGGTGGWCLHCWGQGGACGQLAQSTWTRSSDGDGNAACAIVYSGCELSGGYFSSGSCSGGGGVF